MSNTIPIGIPESGSRAQFISAARAMFPSQTQLTRAQIRSVAQSIGKRSLPLWIVNDNTRRITHGLYSVPECGTAADATATTPAVETNAIPMNARWPKPQSAGVMTFAAAAVMGMTGGERDTLIPPVSAEYVPWGHFTDIERIVKTRLFAPTYITGMSGNGKTTMVEQICAKLGRECFRCNIVAETDEDDLLGGFRLQDGNTVWQDGPAVEAMKRGGILLLDEIDLGTSKLMCLQPILEGKGVYLKKINKWVIPASGFTIFATANTKGKGSDDGRYIGTNIMNEAMLDRFDYTYEQDYAPRATERKILSRSMTKYGNNDVAFADNLTKWAEMIRKLFEEGSIDELISTRRLVNIVKAQSVFGDKEKAIRMCLARFDAETSAAFFSAYTKIDGEMIPTEIDPETGEPIVRIAGIDPLTGKKA